MNAHTRLGPIGRQRKGRVLRLSPRLAVVLAGAVVLAAAGLWQLTRGPRLPQGPVPVLVTQDAGTATVALHEGVMPPPGAQPLLLATTGRVLPDGAGFRHQWPAVQAAARFEGDQVLALFDDALNRYRVTLGDTVLLLTRPGRAQLHISGLGPGQHDITLEKLNESPGPARFGGFFLPPGGLALPPPAALPRSITFIGDSDTVGYGNTAPSQDCTAEQVFLTTDTGQSFGPRVARHFGAEARIIAQSGIGLVRNYDGANPGRTLPHIFPLLLESGPSAAEDTAGVIVLAIGSNDFSTPLRAGEAWANADALRAGFQAALLDFLRSLRTANPGALFVLLAFGEYGDDLVAAHRAAFESFLAEGARAELVILPELERGACHWHPSLADHALIAERLIAALGQRDDL